MLTLIALLLAGILLVVIGPDGREAVGRLAAIVGCVVGALLLLATLPPFTLWDFVVFVAAASASIVLCWGVGAWLLGCFGYDGGALDEDGEQVALRNACERVTKSRKARCEENAWRGGKGLR